MSGNRIEMADSCLCSSGAAGNKSLHPSKGDYPGRGKKRIIARIQGIDIFNAELPFLSCLTGICLPDCREYLTGLPDPAHSFEDEVNRGAMLLG